MHNAHRLLNLSYQRAISPDYHGFFARFYQLFTDANPRVRQLFAATDMERQYQMLMESMTHLISFARDQDPSDEMKNMALVHGKTGLGIREDFYDLWLESLIQTVKERDPKFDAHIDKAWRKILQPGIDFMKSFCH